MTGNDGRQVLDSSARRVLPTQVFTEFSASQEPSVGIEPARPQGVIGKVVLPVEQVAECGGHPSKPFPLPAHLRNGSLHVERLIGIDRVHEAVDPHQPHVFQIGAQQARSLEPAGDDH